VNTISPGGKPAPPIDPTERGRLWALAALFLRLGATAFGGPAAHVGLMENEVVRRRRWLTREEFLDLVGATNLIPGPNSTELAIHIGHRRAGWPGLLVAGGCFILPATLIVGVIAWAYVRFGQLRRADGLLYGVKPVIIAVVLQALWRLGRTALKTRSLIGLGVGAATLSFIGVNELAVLFGAGLLMAGVRSVVRRTGSGAMPLLAVVPAVPLTATTAAAGAAATAAPFGLWPMFLFFLKVGSVLFGSGYVLLAFLRADLVDRWHWLTEGQLLDAIAVGQITPGPLFTTATFIGYALGGVPGAVLATAGIFLPAFFFVAVSGPLVPRMRRSPVCGAFLDGVNVASLALMAVVTWQLGRVAVCDWLTAALAVVSAALLVRFRVNSAWLVAGGALIGLIKSFVY
jgi:chromate transporter